jgi:hypothetical protein
MGTYIVPAPSEREAVAEVLNRNYELEFKVKQLEVAYKALSKMNRTLITRLRLVESGDGD